MSKQIYISTRGNTHAVAMTEDGKLVEFNRESEDDASIVGNIYKGRVEKVLKGMQAAFVDIGREKNGYLYVGESIIDGQDLSAVSDLLSKKTIEASEGDEIMVQVAKTEMGVKGARLTSNISLAGKYLVFMPYVNYIGVSRKIVDESVRERLVSLITELQRGFEGGFIIRTAAQFVSESELKLDAEGLFERWEEVYDKYRNSAVLDCSYKEGGILFRVVRDWFSKDVEQLTCDNEKTFEEVKKYVKSLRLDESKIKYYSKNLFYSNGLSAQIIRLIDSKVELDNGAYLVIEKTEALTVIDVNTGKYIGSTNLEETVFETNVLAAKAIASQLRLRNIGGIIIVDFIDMATEEHKNKVLEVLSSEVQKDRIRTAVVGMTNLGLVEITRKKARLEVKQKLVKPCPVCGGKGYIMNNAMLSQVLRMKISRIFENSTVTAVMIRVSKEVAEELFESNALTFEINVFWQSKRVYVYPDDRLKQDKYNIDVFESDVINVPNEARLLY